MAKRHHPDSKMPDPQPKSPFDRKQYQHDAFDKSVFRDLDNARNAVRWIFRNAPELLEQLDLDRLSVSEDSYLDEELREYFVDVLYQVPLRNGETICIFILIELKTGSEKFTMYQMLKYILRIWDILFKAARDADQLATFLFPMVFPVIIHHGENRFTAPTKMGDLQEVWPGFEWCAVQLEAMLFDLAQIPESEFPEDPELWSAFTMMQAVFRPTVDEQILKVYKKVSPLFEEKPSLLERWRQMFWYAISSSKYFTKEKCVATIEKIKEVRGENMSIIEQPMYLVDVLLAEGEARGRVEGRFEERSDKVLRALDRRMGAVPESLMKQVRQITDVEKLNDLFDLALDCKSLDEFATNINDRSTNHSK